MRKHWNRISRICEERIGRPKRTIETIEDLMQDSPWIERGGLRYKLIAVQALLLFLFNDRKNKL